MTRELVTTNAGQYEVLIKSGVLEQAGDIIRSVLGESRLFVIADKNVWDCLGGRLATSLRERDWILLATPLGEPRKRMEVIEELCLKMHHYGADRRSAVVAFGGGVAGDIAGFVAAVYMRGIDFIQVPTTLLAQVDSSVGGKTGCNLASGKNLVGAFHQPRLVLIDPSSLDTLSDKEFGAGIQEVIKHGIIRSPELFEFLEVNSEEVLGRSKDAIEYMIAMSVRIKADVVKQDEREGGLRRILNFGHTLGHALEAETGYGLLHGEAVAFGMVAAARLSERRGRLDAQQRRRIESVICNYRSLPVLVDLDARSIAERAAGDKKSVDGKLRFVLADAIGQVSEELDPPSEQVIEAIEHALWVSREQAVVATEP